MPAKTGQTWSERGPGLGVDARGGPVVDPTANVIALSEASTKRQDDLREAANALHAEKISNVKELAELRERHQAELRKAESARLDSIRQVDREDANKTAAQALNAIQTLAATTNTTAETLRNQVAVAAQAASAQLSSVTAEIVKRVSALELALSEGKGKSTVADPALDKLAVLVEQLSKNSTQTASKSEGWKDGIGWVVGILGAIAAVVTVILTR